MIIDHYEFGRVVAEGKEFTHDLIISPGRILWPWWRRQGHYLEPEDLKEVWEEDIDCLIVGTEAYGIMNVSEEVKKMAQRKGIELYTKPTLQAVELFNKLQPQKKLAGAFHLTC